MAKIYKNLTKQAEVHCGIVPYFRNELTRYSGDEWGEIASFKKGWIEGRKQIISYLLMPDSAPSYHCKDGHLVVRVKDLEQFFINLQKLEAEGDE